MITVAHKRGVALSGLSPFWHSASRRTKGIVIGYGTPLEHEYTGALESLGQLMRTAGAR